MTTRRLLALNVGSSTLKGACYLLHAEGPGAQPRVVERSRAEIAVGADAQERLATLLEILSIPAPGPDVVATESYMAATCATPASSTKMYLRNWMPWCHSEGRQGIVTNTAA